MAESGTDALTRRAKADILIESIASQIGDMLHEAARELDTFPFFLGSILIRAIEAEPGGPGKADRGCVIVCPDGELYEYICTITVGGLSPEPMRTEETKKLDLPPQDYIPYAYNALREITKLLLEKQQAS